MLIKLLIPAAIGQFMISQQPKLIAKAVVTPVTHGVVHGVVYENLDAANYSRRL